MGGQFYSNRLIINGIDHILLRFWYVCLINTFANYEKLQEG